jgi:cullin 1
MHQITLKPLTAKLEQVLVGAHKEALQGKFLDFLKEDVTDFTKTDTNDDLKISYSLLKRVEGALDPLKATLEQFIKGVGLQQLEAEKKEAAEKPDAFVNIILRVFRKYTELNNVAFHNDSGFVAALDKAFREFVNKNAVTDQEIPGMDKGIAKAPQILAKFCDAILKRGPTFISDEAEMERTQTDIVSLFKYFPDKDVFMLVYSKLLSKRLIQDLSASEDAEASMINKLKSAQGFEYCMKLQRMMTDMQLCKGMNKDFQEFCETAKSVLPFSFNLYVLATGSWPLQTIMSNFQPPAVVRSAIDQFKVFYDKKYQGRKLSYLHHMSRAEVDMRPNIKGKKFILQTTTYQMGALMLFAEVANTSIKLRDILAQTQLQEAMLKQNLIPLVKLKILTVTADGGPAPDTWNENTVFSVNQKFLSKKVRVQCVPGPIAIRTPADKEAAAAVGGAGEVDDGEIMKDRVLKLQAAIVRIMKARKSFSHTELVQETISQVARWFAPKVPHIKKAIESLIDQEYIKRGTGSTVSPNTYEYIA